MDLSRYFPIADALAALCAPLMEVVVHDLASDTVAHVAQPFSPRAPGDPSDLREISFKPDASVIGPYEKTNFDGRRIKSISAVLRDEKGRPIGLLCANMDVSQFHALQGVLQAFLGPQEPVAEVEAAFRDDWHEKVNRFVAAWTGERRLTLDRLDREARRELIEALHASGGFEGRRAPAYVAQILGISRATVYNELARLKAALAA